MDSLEEYEWTICIVPIFRKEDAPSSPELDLYEVEMTIYDAQTAQQHKLNQHLTMQQILILCPHCTTDTTQSALRNITRLEILQRNPNIYVH